MHIQAMKAGQRVTLVPTPPELEDVLRATLTFEQSVSRHKGGRSRYDTIRCQCFRLDGKNRIVYPFGLHERVVDKLAAFHQTVELVETRPHPNPKVYEPHWDMISDFELRYGQEKVLRTLLAHANGQIHYTMGAGKSFLIGLYARLLPKARFAIVSREVSVVRDRLYPDLCKMLPHVGMVCGGKRIRGERIMLFNVMSFRHAYDEPPFDIVIYDEAHEAGAPYTARVLAGLRGTYRIHGLSGTLEMRTDNADFRVEAIFGPIRATLHHTEAVAHGLVAPVEVRVKIVASDVNPCKDDSVPDWKFKKACYWRNKKRNRIALKIAEKHVDDQVLISVETVEHLIYLRKIRPDLPVLFAPAALSAKNLARLRRYKLPYQLLPNITPERRQKLTRLFRKGKLRLLAATPIFNVGMDLPQLGVVIRLDGGSSEIRDNQLPGRTVRKNPKDKAQENKVGIVYDFDDRFNHRARMRSRKRFAKYEKAGFRQVMIP